MTECRECNSEISEKEAFCPYCGIATASIAAKPAQEESFVDEEDLPTIGGEEVDSQNLETDIGDAETVIGIPFETPDEADQIDEDENEFIDVSSLKSEESVEIDSEPAPEPVELNKEEEVLTTSALADETDDSDAGIEPNEEEVEKLEEDDGEVSEKEEVDIAAIEKNEEVEEIVDSAEVESDDSASKEKDTIEPVAEVEIVDTGVSKELIEKDIKEEIQSKEEEVVNNEPVVAAEPSFRVEPKSNEDEVSVSEPTSDDPDFTETIPYISADIGEMKIVGSEKEAESAVEPVSETPDETSNEDAPQREPEIAPKSEEVLNVSGSAVEEVPEPEIPEPENSDKQPSESMSEVPLAVVEPGVDEEVKPYTTPNIGAEDTDGSNKTKLKPLGEGTVLNGRYEIVRKIGGGGMGAVYLANDRNLGGVLRAVKEMVQSYIEEEQQDKAISDFKRESMLLTTLEHAAIPTIYDYFFDDKESRFYLVMKYISGGDLSGRLRSATEGKLDERTVVEWGIEIADVLDYLHNHEPPIVYRDLKPANIMLDGNTGRVMLIDFGIARWVNKEEKGVTAVGTMGYAPPELFSGNVEPRSDIYSLGSTMFHLLTGADPQSNPLLIFDFDKNPRPRQINSSLSDGIEKILMKSVEYNADGRFNSTAEFRDVLTEHLRNLISGKVTYGVSETPSSVSLADQSVFCGFCGQKIVATDMFCAFCGAKQPLAQPGVQSEAYVPAKATAKLFIQGTSELNAPTFEIEKNENLVGRRDPMSNIFPEVDLSKFDPQTKISRKHARIWRDGDSFMLEDLGSSNGTILESNMSGETRLSPKEPRRLSSGDIIKLGDTILHFVIG